MSGALKREEGRTGPALRVVSLCCTAALAAVPVAAEVPRLEIIAQGKSAYVIAIPDDAGATSVNAAAKLLQSKLFEATGVTLAISRESQVAAGSPAIYLGKSQAARRAGLPLEALHGWACLDRVVGRDVFLAGEDGAAAASGKAGMEPQGTTKAVTRFLEEQAGVRFVLPGERGTHVPKLERLAIDAAMDRSWTPVFDYVIGRTSTDRAYAVANNFFGQTALLRSYGGHSYYSAVPAKDYAEKHPEYFALIGGVRDARGNHLCISNPEVQGLMLQEMEKQLDRGFEWVELGQTDGYQACECPNCAALHADKGERLWIVHQKLAEAMLKRRPGKKVMIISYGPTANPPRTVRRFPENVIIQMCRYSPESFAEWAPLGVPKTVYLYNWGFYHSMGIAPLRTPRAMVDQVRLFKANDVRGIYLCGGLDGRENGLWGLDGPAYYAFGKALGDPGCDGDALLREYVEAAFGEAAAPMRAFFNALYERLDLCSRLPEGSRAFVTPEDFFCHFFPAKTLSDMTADLARAQAVAGDAKVKARLELVDMEFRYVKATATVYQFYRTYRLTPTAATLDLVASAVQARREVIDGIYPSGRVRAVEGLRAPLGEASKAFAETGGRAVSAPLNWDFALLKEKGVLPGVGMKRVACPRVEGIVLDGRLDEAAWQGRGAEELGEIGMGKLKNATRFLVGYDAANLYFGITCEVDSLDALDAVKPLGRDGAAHTQEDVEIMLDAQGLRERYCHLVFNPVALSTFDRRFGYIQDPFHPLYNKPDASWNGTWEYAVAVDRERKRWTAEVRVPFATLESEPPTPGTIWTMNLGRTEWPLGPGKHPYVLSLWSPNLESRSFHDRGAFGEVVFK